MAKYIGVDPNELKVLISDNYETDSSDVVASTRAVNTAVIDILDYLKTIPGCGNSANLSSVINAIDFVGIPSTAKTIQLLLKGISTNGTSPLVLRLGSGSIVSSGYISQAWNNSGGGIVSSGIVLTNGNISSNLFTGILNLVKMNDNTWISSSVLSISNSTGIGTSGNGSTPAFGSSIDRLQLIAINGTDVFDSGLVSISWTF